MSSGLRLLPTITTLLICMLGLLKFPQYRIIWVAVGTLSVFLLIYTIVKTYSDNRVEVAESREYADWDLDMDSELMKEGECNMYKVDCNVQNTGAGTDDNATLYISADIPNTDTTYDEKIFPLPILGPNESHSVTTLLEIPAGEDIIISCTVIGDANTAKIVTDTFAA